MSQLDSIKAPVISELKNFNSHFRNSVKSNVSLLNIVMKYILKTKGKQLRPLFVLLVAKLHGNIRDSTYTAASLIELLHTATLIHDDVVDDSYERRAFFSINALWKSKVAVLIGDYLLSKGLLISMENNEYELLRIVSNAVREMIEGELLQTQKSRKLNITETEYFEIIRKKTATLIAACCACGAYSVGADQKKVSDMWQFGQMLGIAFQIKDDLLDYNSKNLTGKPSANDIKEKKLTLPLIYSLGKSKNSQSKKILRIINAKNHNPLIINDIIEYVHQSGGIVYTEKKMVEYKNKALDLISDYPSSAALDSIKELSDFVINRSK